VRIRGERPLQRQQVVDEQVVRVIARRVHAGAAMVAPIW
jgi:acid stress-induced BolA-like protein IbaG/YrbA